MSHQDRLQYQREHSFSGTALRMFYAFLGIPVSGYFHVEADHDRQEQNRGGMNFCGLSIIVDIYQQNPVAFVRKWMAPG